MVSDAADSLPGLCLVRWRAGGARNSMTLDGSMVGGGSEEGGTDCLSPIRVGPEPDSGKLSII